MFHLIVLLALACLYLLLCLQAALEPTRASFMSCLLTLILGLTFTFGGFYCRWNRNCRLAMSHIEDWSHWSLADIHLHAHTSCYQDIGSVVPLVVKNWISDFRITPPDLHWKTNKHCFCWRSKQIIVLPLSLPVWPACHSIWCTLFVSYIFIGNLCAVAVLCWESKDYASNEIILCILRVSLMTFCWSDLSPARSRHLSSDRGCQYAWLLFFSWLE